MLKQKLPPKVWFQGSQSTRVCTRSSRNGQTCASICWLAHSMRCVLITPFGAPVEPDVNRIFATVSGFRRENATSSVEPGLVSSSRATGVEVAPTAASAPANFSGSAANTSPGRSSSKMDFSLAKSFDISEYAGEIGATGTPTCIAPSASRACSTLLSERIATGRDASSPRLSSAWPMRRASDSASR